MKKNLKSLKALKEGNLEKVAGGGVYQTVAEDKYGALVEMGFTCENCGKKINQARIYGDETLCDECYKKMNGHL